MGLYFRCHQRNIRRREVLTFLRHLLRHLRGPVIVVWDNAPIHKGAAVRDLCCRFPRLQLEYFPPYAPELNPDEGVWSDAKGRLANGCPDDIEQLYRRLYRVLHGLKRSSRRLRRCVHQTPLPLF